MSGSSDNKSSICIWQKPVRLFPDCTSQPNLYNKDKACVIAKEAQRRQSRGNCRSHHHPFVGLFYPCIYVGVVGPSAEKRTGIHPFEGQGFATESSLQCQPKRPHGSRDVAAAWRSSFAQNSQNPRINREKLWSPEQGTACQGQCIGQTAVWISFTVIPKGPWSDVISIDHIAQSNLSI